MGLLVAVGGLSTRAADALPPDKERSAWQSGTLEYHPSRVIVRFRSDVAATAGVQALGDLGYAAARPVSFRPAAALPDGLTLYVVELPEDQTAEQAVSRLSQLPGVLYVERDWKVYKDQAVLPRQAVMPGDPAFVAGAMWGLHNQDIPEAYVDPYMEGEPVDDADIDMPEGWGRHTDSSQVVVAVIDTGIYVDHPDLADNMWVNEAELYGQPGVDDDQNGYVDDLHGWDFFNNDNSVWDPDERDIYGYLNDEHGTHVAGTIGALTNNGIGVAGINWRVQIMALKFLGPDGGYTSDAIRALAYASANGAMLTTNSWGGGPFSQALKDAIEASGMLFVAAAGNSNVNNDMTPHYPSSYDSPNIIAVAAIMQNDQRAHYPGWWGSNYGAQSVDLFAPGGFILSTVPPDPPPAPGEPPEEAYAFFYGTSMATPHVTGVGAALIAQHPSLPQYPGASGWTPGSPTIKDIILQTVDRKPQFEGLVSTGGRLNAAQAFAMSLPPIITEASADPTEGPPPLTVSFSAQATDPDGEVVDVWWDFGDGSEPVHAYTATHVYQAQGHFDATFHAVDDSGLESVVEIPIRVFLPPDIEVSPTSIDVALEWDETEERILTIANRGQGPLAYTVGILPGVGPVAPASGTAVDVRQLELAKEEPDPRSNPPQPYGRGGPDEYGYVWVDSDEPGGPRFEWRDIRQIGVRLPIDGDESYADVDLPFEFPFYGEPESRVRVSSNGYLTFGTSGSDWSNDPIPSTAQPNDLIAVFWDDLTLADGAVYAWGSAEEGRFIVQYDGARRLGGAQRYDFQVILSADGSIIMQYLRMEPGRLNEATIGIEDASGEVGLQVAFNQEYVHDELAIGIYPMWVSASPAEGTVQPGEAEEVILTFRALRLPEGEHPATVVVRSDDPDEPEVSVATTLFVNAVQPPVIQRLTAEPWAGSAPLEVHFSAEVRDPDGQVVSVRWDFGDGSDPVSGVLDVVHVYEAEGEYDARLTVVDDEGLTTVGAVHVIARPQPSIAVEPPSFTALVRAHRTRTETLLIRNTGEVPLDYAIRGETIEGPAAVQAGELPPWEPGSKDAVDPRSSRLHPQGFGGPDRFGYIWRDSSEINGPAFEWVEISGVGTRVTLSEDGSQSVSLPWPFPFYGQEKTQVVISANGYLTFGTTGGDYTNDPIPSSWTPNDLLAVWWDDLSPQRGDGVYYYHDPVADRFVVQWTNVPRWPGRGSYTFQVVLYPDGRIVYQYLDMAFGDPTDESSATIGIENADGSDGLEVLFNAAGYIHDELAIAFWPYQWLTVEPQAGTVQPGETAEVEVVFDLTLVGGGTLDGSLVIESNDLVRPEVRVPVHIEVLANQHPVIDGVGVNPSQGPLGTTFQFVAAANDPDGSIADVYWDFGDGSDRVGAFVASHTYAQEGVYTATFTAVDNDGYRTSAIVTVRVQDVPQARWAPSQLFMETAAGRSTSATLTLSNDGAGPLVFGSAEEETLRVSALERLVAPQEVRDPDARTAEGLYASNPDPSRSPWLPDAVGDVITSWPAPAPIGVAWGVGVDWETGHVLISDPELRQDFVVPPDGRAPIASWSTPWAGSWPGDMAFDGAAVWQLNVGGNNGLYRLDPETGEVLASITSVPWGISQRGLAYDPETDTFFVGGWNEDVIYRVAGLSHPNPGARIESWSMPVGIAGLAYHPTAGILIVASNADPDLIYFVDVATRTTVAQFAHPANGSYNGAGIELDADGNLWVASQGNNRLYLVETGLGPVRSWLRWEPESGEVPPGGAVDITVTVDASALHAGEHRGSVVLTTNDPEHPLIMVPVSARVAAAPVITEATAEPTLGEPPLLVRFRAAVTPGDSPLVTTRWDFGDGRSADGLAVEHVYTDEGRYEATFTVVDTLGGTASVSIPIEVRLLPSPTVEPTRIETTLSGTGVERHTVTIGNVDGSVPLEFRVRVREGASPSIALPHRVGKVVDPDARTAQGLYEPLAAEVAQRIRANVRPNAVGDVLASWPLPAEVDLGWGVGYDDTKLWISDADQLKDFWTTSDGQLLGDVDTPWAGSWPADLAYDENHGLIWQVNVGGDNALYGLDPQTGEVVAVIDDPQWSAVSQRGVAYRDDNDTLYVGGWNQDIIYQIKGLSWDRPGQVLGAWSLSGAGISGLAWHPSGILWVATNSPGDYIYGLDLEALEIVYQFPGPSGSDYLGAGLALNADGNLWAVTQDNMAYLISTERPIRRGITVEPTSGTVPPGESRTLTVTIDAAQLGLPGQDVASYLEITTNHPLRPVLTVDVLTHILPGPSIEEISVTPTLGEPPLEVSVSARVTGPVHPIVDVWWDFGDGSEPMHALSATHVYTSEGTYEVSFHAVDAVGVETVERRTVEVRYLPVLEVEPPSIEVQLTQGEQAQQALTIRNAGQRQAMNFWITTAPSFSGSPEYQRFASRPRAKGEAEPRGWPVAYGSGGPDQYGYVWIDSREANGPRYEWVEIRDVGTRVTLEDESGVVVDLPWSFPFYGELKQQVAIASNGYLTFGTATRGYWSNTPIPDPAQPNDLIAPFWTDLNPGQAGSVYYHYDEANDWFIVEYEAVPEWGMSGSAHTFQVILHRDGSILYQYRSLQGDLTSVTVGIENATGSDGLQVVYNAPYLEDGLAVLLTPVGRLVQVAPEAGYLLPGMAHDVLVTLGDPAAAPGVYRLNLFVMSDDPFRPQVVVPVTVDINGVPQVSILAPQEGAVLQGPAEIRWRVDDDDEVSVDLAYTSDGGESWTPIVQGLTGVDRLVWETESVPAGDGYRVRVTATDPEGQVGHAVSGAFAVHRPPQATILTPEPGSILVRPQVEIRWEASDLEDGDDVAIDLHYRIGHGGWRRIAFNQPNTGQYTWDIRGVETSAEVALRLSVRDQEGGLRQVVVEPLTVTDLPMADFGFEPSDNISTETDIRFVDRSSDPDGVVSAWRWSFGDGATSAQQHPTHRYARPGIYDVRLVAVDDVGAPSAPARQTLAVGTPDAPVVGFAYEDTVPGEDWLDAMALVGLWVTKYGDGTPRIAAARFEGDPVGGAGFQEVGGFFDLHLDASDGVARLEGRWHFPEDVAHPESLVLVWYDPQAGRWARVEPQSLIVAPGGGYGGYIRFTLDASSTPRIDQLGGTLFGGVVNRAPTAAFAVQPESPTVLDTVRFVDASSDPDDNLVAWTWDFGDGATSTERHPEHRYARKGTYVVRLTVTDAGGEDATVERVVQVVNAAPVAAFRHEPEALTILDTVRFVHEATDPDGEDDLVAWAWDFGDGATSSERHPEHRYARKGTYTVRLTVTDADGASTTAQRVLQVGNVPPQVRIVEPKAGTVWTGIQVIEYEATDADGDPLTIAFDYRVADGGDEWQPIAQGQPNAGKFAWNTASVKRGGRYELRVTASDGEASARAVSEPVVISVVEGLVTHGPNPARDAVAFYFNLGDRSGELHVFRIDGRPVARWRLTEGTTSLVWDLTDADGRLLGSGLYLYVVVMETGETSGVRRLVVER